jgi:hypothetical protein
MMSLIVCISCVKKKRLEPSEVADLYVSSLFTFALRYAKSLNPDHIFVLSARHGLLSLNDEIPPYEQTLNNMPRSDRIKWANLVLGQLKNHADLENDKFVFLAGDKYRNLLVPHIKNYSVPMLGMGLGKQIQWLKGQVDQ